MIDLDMAFVFAKPGLSHFICMQRICKELSIAIFVNIRSPYKSNRSRVMYTLYTYLFHSIGGHNWFPFSSKAKQLDDGTIQVLRYGAWVTSAGFADFYVVESTSPSFGGDFMNLSVFLMFKVTCGLFVSH